MAFRNWFQHSVGGAKFLLKSLQWLTMATVMFPKLIESSVVFVKYPGPWDPVFIS